MLAGWDDSDTSSSEEEQHEDRANFCLMVHGDSEEEVSNENSSDFTFDELLDAFHELMHDSTQLARKLKDMKIMHRNANTQLNEAHAEIKKLKSENKALTSNMHEESNFEKGKLRTEINKLNGTIKDLEHENSELKDKILDLTSSTTNLISENKSLKLDVEKYKPIVDKFTYSSEKLNMILNSQRAVFNKAGLGYNPNQKQKLVKNFFRKVEEPKSFTCHCCNKSGHKSYECSLRKISNTIITNRLGLKTKQIWVQKGTNVETLRTSKKIWIPKLT